jgi:hypothetical protein
MGNYGLTLDKKGAAKGKIAIVLATELDGLVTAFFTDNPDFAQTPDKTKFTAFKDEFLKKLHSEDQAMSEYRLAWGTVIANILIALTGIGVLFIGAQLAYTYCTEGRARFFFQQPKTSSEEKIANLDACVDFISNMP